MAGGKQPRIYAIGFFKGKSNSKKGKKMYQILKKIKLSL
jgi:hypothetical protein